MSSFGGSIKLTGEDEYRIALNNITTGLREVSSQLSLTTTQFQNSDKSTSNLKKAQQDPEKYKNLQVRVCGWNAYFVNLSKPEQDAFIRQAENN